MRLVVIGDVGVVDGMMHIGDEAMFEALCDEMRARGAEIVAVSSAPEETAARYGIDAIGRIDFDLLSRTDAEARLDGIDAALGGAVSTDDRIRTMIAEIRSADAVIIAGAGNLASTWPTHIYERVAMSRIAQSLGRPLIVTGQTLGPELNERDRELVGEIVQNAALVGVRETTSQALSSVLGAPARLGVDDASFLAWDDTELPSKPSGVLISLSLHLGGADRVETTTRIAALADAAAGLTGEPVRFHAHFGALENVTPRGDALLHDEIRDRMRSASEVLPTGTPREAALAARSAALLITGRYHPAVFAAPAGVPVLGLVTDEYTRIKQRGALAHWGQSSTVALAAADTDGIPVLEALWEQRESVAQSAAQAVTAARVESASWWTQIAESVAKTPKN
ncbi:polysaccharide pyruvyl transferase WcaK-like protein [Microbacterium endophyticum]|uniref:Polysaccharide pyruvyl transferase WcaK-like protein n=1 Tax=Microbacterium endophyticum TaxID=1526412 RepID=A0A7W4YN65_9MICO|nr:polysaccharide pyruvyl transferase family protein [Microbacterium endophyticum]MBB2976254.1 polysaccharide pyruvyl transferase WcaK-like protein [Microbacterium endophyticum]NIK35134.1 polysaccharide pyruvyl transferase WcaK-like protein [Microbacterium endophyticum]